MAATDNAAEQVAHIAEKIRAGKTTLGIEFGSTRIKAVPHRRQLTRPSPPATTAGPLTWRMVCGATPPRRSGAVCSPLTPPWPNDVETAYGEKLTHVGHIGFSAMMHGYLAFDEAGELLVPFRTWQNTNTSEAHKKLSELFQYNIPRALVHRSPVPGRAQQGRARLQGGLLHHTRRLRALEAHR